MNHDTSQTRHAKYAPSPEDVYSLAHNHPAVTGRRTIFPSTVKPFDEANRILVSGDNNRKIGKTVVKGDWAGLPIYTLTLEERATCPASCHMFRNCYGNAMRWARRIRHGDEFETALVMEVEDLAASHADGFVVRLHVLGDFYSRAYVYLWQQLLETHQRLHLYGYTARLTTSDDEDDRDIANAILEMNDSYPERCFIRFSSDQRLPGGATVVSGVPEGRAAERLIVCPAETDATACCATCALCWAPAARGSTIAFLKHGAGSSSVRAEIRAVAKTSGDSKLRPVRPFRQVGELRPIEGKILDIRQVDPTELVVDESYQRSPSRKSADLITRIASQWNWRKFTPPRVAEHSDGVLHVIDGQHTAIAAASRPDIEKIPVIVVDASTMEQRANTFIGINADRIAVTPSQIFYAQVAAGDPEAVGVKRMCEAAEVVILRSPPPNKDYGPGETMAISTLRRLYRDHGAETGKRVLDILLESALMPIQEWAIQGVAKAITDKTRGAALRDSDVYQVLRGRGAGLHAELYERKARTGKKLGDCCADLILEALT